MSSVVFGNPAERVNWKPSNESRGTWDILSTCVLTMILCVWTAVHLNVPPPGALWALILRKLGWLFMGLIAPELVAASAWNQRQEAASLVELMNQAKDNTESRPWKLRIWDVPTGVYHWFKKNSAAYKRKIHHQPTSELKDLSRQWTLVQGFYATMGGFGIRMCKLQENQDFSNDDANEVCFLTAQGLKLFVKMDPGFDWVPHLSENDIQTRSKADGLAKALVCAQAAWFLAQCITRLVQHIPISLLELNTFGHAFCALVIYILWWEKPFQVDYPIMIDRPELEKRRALELMKIPSDVATSAIKKIRVRLATNPRFQQLKKKDQRNLLKNLKCELDLLMLCEEETTEATERRLKVSHNNSADTQMDTHYTFSPNYVLQAGQKLHGTRWRMKHASELFDDDVDGSLRKSLEECLEGRVEYSPKDKAHAECINEARTYDLPSVQLRELDVKRWSWASDAPQFDSEKENAKSKHFGSIYKTTLVRKCEELPWREAHRSEKKLFRLGVSVAGVIYGGLHTLAWSATFDSDYQRLLWRISSCAVMGGYPALIFQQLFKEKCGQRWKLLAKLMIWLIGTFYVLARGYLVVECFINLSNLPVGVYKIPRWTAYVPHIS